ARERGGPGRRHDLRERDVRVDLAEAGDLRRVGRWREVDAEADRDPVEPLTAPTRLDEDAAELAIVNQQVVRPLEAHRRRRPALEDGCEPQTDAQGEDVEPLARP